MPSTRPPDGKYKVRVIGFAKIIGSLLDGMMQVMMYFGAAFVIAGVILFYFTRCCAQHRRGARCAR